MLGDIMYCDNCGAKVEKGKKFCDNCGSTVRRAEPADYKEVEKNISSKDKHLPYQPTPPALQRRSISVALISLFLPGIGHIYVDKLLSGVGFFFGAIGIGTIAGIFLDWGWNYASYVVLAILGSYLIGGTVYVTLLIRRYNRFLEINLRKPTPKEKW